MRVRVTNAPPAPVMDGFDMRDLRPGRIYELDDRFARYLIVAGYALLEGRAETAERSRQRRKDKRLE